nr:GDCCVxC domain-containing (seleno)protein [Nitrosomonas nitrosa]
MEVITRSVIICPHCKGLTEAEVPTDACVVFFECLSCHAVLRPKLGDCCVFCSYARIKCPPVQLRQDCDGSS